MAKGKLRLPETSSTLAGDDRLYRSIIETSRVIIIEMDMAGTVTFMNPYAQTYFGYAAEELVGRNVVGTIVPDERLPKETIRTMLHHAGQGPGGHDVAEAEHMLKDCTRVWVLWSVDAMSGGGEGSVLLIGADITERKAEEEILKTCCGRLERKVKEHTSQLVKANEALQQEVSERKWTEEVLRSSEEKYRLVVENANEAIVVIQDGLIKYFNPKTVKVLNRPAEELSERLVDDFIHPDDRHTATNRRLKMIRGESGPSVYSLRVVDREGVVKWLEINTVLITWMGRPATLSFFNNITERKLAEDEVKTYQEQLRSLASELSLAEEKERRRLANDLHDHIGQTLAIVKIKLGALRDQLPEELVEQVDYVRSLMDDTIRSSKSLTFQLSPPTLYDVGLEATLEWLGEQVQNEHGVRFIFVDDDKDKPLDRDVSVLMYQAVRELVMNIVKHARAAKFSISTCKYNNTFQVVVEDNGEGFDPAAIGSDTFGFFSIRERINRFGGTFEIYSKPGLGTRVYLNAPIRIKGRKTLKVLKP